MKFQPSPMSFRSAANSAYGANFPVTAFQFWTFFPVDRGIGANARYRPSEAHFHAGHARGSVSLKARVERQAALAATGAAGLMMAPSTFGRPGSVSPGNGGLYLPSRVAGTTYRRARDRFGFPSG
jgi:hypothetical protein